MLTYFGLGVALVAAWWIWRAWHSVDSDLVMSPQWRQEQKRVKE